MLISVVMKRLSLTLGPSAPRQVFPCPGGRGMKKPFSPREKGGDEGVGLHS